MGSGKEREPRTDSSTVSNTRESVVSRMGKGESGVDLTDVDGVTATM